MNKKDFYKNYYSDFKMSENEKRMMLNDLHAELSSGTKPLYSKLKFKAAVSVALSVCIISSALTYSQYADRHNIPVQTETDKAAVTDESLCQTDVINSDTITVNTDVPQSSETYSYDDFDYTEISESRISDTEKSSETEPESSISETHDSINTARETDSELTVITKTEETAIMPHETTSYIYSDETNDTSSETDATPEETNNAPTDDIPPETDVTQVVTDIVTTVFYPETTFAQATTTYGEVPESTNTEETTTTTSETTVPAYEYETEIYYSQPSVSQPPEETY